MRLSRTLSHTYLHFSSQPIRSCVLLFRPKSEASSSSLLPFPAIQRKAMDPGEVHSLLSLL